MLKFLKNMINKSFTENGEVTNKTTQSYCLDLFATIGAMRKSDVADIRARFLKAFVENPSLALKIVFYARDIRGGLGERRVFREIINYLAYNKHDVLEKNIANIPEFGRYDDLIAILNTPCENLALEFIKNQLTQDLQNYSKNNAVSLLAKWLPSINTSSETARVNGKKIARYLNMSDKEYRQTLVKLRKQIKIIENNLREKNYTFDYSVQPAKAMLKYRGAFIRNDYDRYMEYLNSVQNGTMELKTATLTPFELVRIVLTQNLSLSEQKVLNTTWDNLPDYKNDTNTLAIIDTSGSMTSYNYMPLATAISLGLYFAERNRGAFANHFMEFSNTPELIEIKGKNFVDKVKFISSFCQVADTNIESVFDVILATAVKHKLPQKSLPERLVIISDMEFNSCVRNSSLSNFENAKNRFAKYGYKLPEVVFWNVCSRNRHQPVEKNEQGVALISGFTPNLFEMVAEGITTPYEFMLKTLNNERYKNVTA